MMDLLRSTMQTLGVTVSLVCALSLAGLGTSQARSSKSAYLNGQPCNTICRAYMNWSDRLSLSWSPLKKHAFRHEGLPRTTVHHAPRMRQPGLTSFAQFPLQGEATPETADTPPAVETSQARIIVPSRPVDRIADRSAATAESEPAILAGIDGATNHAAESTVVAAADATLPRDTGTVEASAGGLRMRVAMSLFLALCALPALGFWWWFRDEQDAERERALLLMSDRTLTMAPIKPIPIEAASTRPARGMA